MAWINPFKYTKREKQQSDVIIRQKKTIEHLLAPHQRKFYKLYKNNTETGLYCTRKAGKTFTTILIAFEKCINKPKAIVRYVMPTLKTAKDVLLPILDEIKDIFPTDLYPKILVSTMTVVFKNGSQIRICGANREAAESARGPRSDLIIADEIPAWDAYAEYMLTGILIPQGTTVPDFKILYSGTPPENVMGYFIQSVYPKLQLRKTVVSINIYENPLLTPAMIERIIDMYPKGAEDPNFQREYMLKIISDQSLRLTPEFEEERHVLSEEHSFSISFGKIEIPQTYQCYVAADTGIVDNTAILSGFFDHDLQKLIILDEFVEPGINPTTIAGNIITAQDNIRHLAFHPEKGIVTVIDAFPGEHAEYRDIHNIIHQYPRKGTVESNISHLRSALENDKVSISKNCKRLIWELNNCVWKESITDNKQIARNVDQKHGDAIMALTYMLRAVNWRFRPGKVAVNFKLGDHSPNEDSAHKPKHFSQLWGDIRRISSG